MKHLIIHYDRLDMRGRSPRRKLRTAYDAGQLGEIIAGFVALADEGEADVLIDIDVRIRVEPVGTDLHGK